MSTPSKPEPASPSLRCFCGGAHISGTCMSVSGREALRNMEDAAERVRAFAAGQPEPWPFAPGDVVRDSGENGDDAAWLDSAPVGVHVVDRHSNPWRRFPKGWASPKSTGDGSNAPSGYLAGRGPITVTSLTDAHPAAPSAPVTPAVGVRTSEGATGAPGGAGEVGLGGAIRTLMTTQHEPTRLSVALPVGDLHALAGRADELERARDELSRQCDEYLHTSETDLVQDAYGRAAREKHRAERAEAQIERVRAQLVRMTKTNDRKTRNHGTALLHILDAE